MLDAAQAGRATTCRRSRSRARWALSNRRLPSGQFAAGNREYLLETGEFLRTAEDVRNVVVGRRRRPAGLRAQRRRGRRRRRRAVAVRPHRARRLDGVPAGRHHRGRQAQGHERGGRRGERPAATSRPLKGSVIPGDVQLDITRHYGETAAEKSNELLFHMLIAVVSVSILIALTLGFRESLIVFIAIPVTLALTLAVFYLYGYTLNRITLFALIFSIGILVDDAIVVVENIVRHWRMPANRKRAAVRGGGRGRGRGRQPTILATLTVVAAILPMAFVGGLMGPYMRPIPIGASAAMVFSLLVASS